MNCLSILLDNAAAEGKFKYHHRCEEAKLTHLCFADDLLIFCDGSIQSVQNIMEILKEFEQLSGLAVSVHKTSFYSSGLLPTEIAQISSATGLNHGSLPIRYLGIPLSSKKLSMLNCEPLLQLIKSKVNTWSTRALSFAGRLLLINTVINGITNFWCSTFIIPKACIKMINSYCNAFLWKGTTEGHNSARVSWDKVTLSKEEGGLGCRDLVAWNKACMLKLVWLLFCKAGSIWVAWFTKVILSGSLSNYWTVKIKQKNTWLVNKLLKLREHAYNWVKRRVENGRQTRFWTDPWSEFGNLSVFLSSSNTRRLRIAENATLSDLYINGSWHLQPARSDTQVQVQSYLSTITLTTQEDYHEWEIEGIVWGKYQTGQMYRILKNHAAIVPWSNVVWFSGGIPKHCFLNWLFVLNRCPTKDRMLTWGLNVDPVCVLCNSALESREHIFFECPFSWSIWSTVCVRINIPASRDWEMILSEMVNLQGNRSKKRLILLAWQCVVYLIWQERNSRIHRHTHRSEALVLSAVDRTIRNYCASRREDLPKRSSEMYQLWSLSQI